MPVVAEGQLFAGIRTNDREGTIQIVNGAAVASEVLQSLVGAKQLQGAGNVGNCPAQGHGR